MGDPRLPPPVVRRPSHHPPPAPPDRQQGKTTTLSKFIAALAVGSVAGGNLCFVYSTGLDRAQEVVKVSGPDAAAPQMSPPAPATLTRDPRTFQASRAVIDWLRTTTFPEEAGYAKIRIARDNERMYGIKNPVGGVNEVAARPRTVESCRGDNPWAVVDEIAFVKKVEHLQVSGSPAPPAPLNLTPVPWSRTGSTVFSSL